VCVRPGVVEGFIGITVLEAQALGVPVLSFDTEDVRLAITDGETGLLVPRGDVAALAAAVRRLLDDPALAARIAQCGRAHVERTYALPAVVSRLEQLYGQVLDESKGR
jgi:glycogen(starch) synthase